MFNLPATAVAKKSDNLNQFVPRTELTCRHEDTRTPHPPTSALCRSAKWKK